MARPACNAVIVYEFETLMFHGTLPRATPDRTAFQPKGAPAPATMDDLPGLDAMDFGGEILALPRRGGRGWLATGQSAASASTARSALQHARPTHPPASTADMNTCTLYVWK